MSIYICVCESGSGDGGSAYQFSRQEGTCSLRAPVYPHPHPGHWQAIKADMERHLLSRKRKLGDSPASVAASDARASIEAVLAQRPATVSELQASLPGAVAADVRGVLDYLLAAGVV